MAEQNSQELVLVEAQKKFEMVCQQANQVQLVDNFGAAFTASIVILQIREVLSDEIMSKVFMPLMNTRIGFLTDRDPKKAKPGKMVTPYTIDVVRDCIAEAVCRGLQPTGNQFNIIAGNMYPTKSGYEHLLGKYIKNWVPYVGSIEKDEKTERGREVVIPTHMSYHLLTDKNEDPKRELKLYVRLPMHEYDSLDQINGKAEARLFRQMYKNVANIDLGISDGERSLEDTEAVVVESHVQQNANQQTLNMDAEAAKPVGGSEEPSFMK